MDTNNINESNCDEIILNFDDMNLKEELLRGIYAYGFEKPSDIQQRAIMPCIKGMDVIAKSQSGSGKTATFLIAILQQIDTELNECQALILVLNRELAIQIQKVIQAFGQYMNVECHVCIGGTNVRELSYTKDIQKLESGVHIVVGIPLRVNDVIKRRYLRTDNIKIFVLDETNILLSTHKNEIFNIFNYLNKDRQIIFMSENTPEEVFEASKSYMREPKRIFVKNETPKGIKQFFVSIKSEDLKFDKLRDLYENLTITQFLIFCNPKSTVEYLTKRMQERDLIVSHMHGAMNINKLKVMISDFRSGLSRFLITTDNHRCVPEIDFQQISLIINYDMPANRQNYIHRIGRFGRFGRKCTAINFVISEYDKTTINDIEEFYGTKIEELPINVADII